MTQITEKSITEAVMKVDNLSEEELEEMSEKYSLQQSDFLGYILSSVIAYDSEELGGYLMYYFNAFLEAVHIQGVEMKKIEEETIDEFQEEYIKTLDEYMETDDEDLIATLCNQPMMLSFMISEIHSEDENGEELSEEMASQLFIVGIAIVGLINRGLIGKNEGR